MTNKEALQQKIQKNEELYLSISTKIEKLVLSKTLLADKLEAQRFALKHIKVEKEIVVTEATEVVQDS